MERSMLRALIILVAIGLSGCVVEPYHHGRHGGYGHWNGGYGGYGGYGGGYGGYGGGYHGDGHGY
jgi:hypothetical protein